MLLTLMTLQYIVKEMTRKSEGKDAILHSPGHEYGISLYLKIMDGNHYYSRTFRILSLYLQQQVPPSARQFRALPPRRQGARTAHLIHSSTSKEDFLIPFDGSLISLSNSLHKSFSTDCCKIFRTFRVCYFCRLKIQVPLVPLSLQPIQKWQKKQADALQAL